MKNKKQGTKMVRPSNNPKLTDYKNYCRKISKIKNSPDVEDSAVQQTKRQNSNSINSAKARKKKGKKKKSK